MYLLRKISDISIILVLVTSKANMKHIDGSNMRPFLKTDGDACILNSAFIPEVMTGFKDASIDYLKLGPGATPVQQEWDYSSLFRDEKSGMLQIVRKGENIEDSRLRDSLQKYINDFKTSFPAVKITSKFQDKLQYFFINRSHIT